MPRDEGKSEMFQRSKHPRPGGFEQPRRVQKPKEVTPTPRTGTNDRYCLLDPETLLEKNTDEWSGTTEGNRESFASVLKSDRAKQESEGCVQYPETDMFS